MSNKANKTTEASETAAPAFSLTATVPTESDRAVRPGRGPSADVLAAIGWLKESYADTDPATGKGAGRTLHEVPQDKAEYVGRVLRNAAKTLYCAVDVQVIPVGEGSGLVDIRFNTKPRKTAADKTAA